MKKLVLAVYLAIIVLGLASCAMVNPYPRDRILTLSGTKVSETEFGGVERWYAVDKYNSSGNGGVRFQVGYFKENGIGFVLYEDGTIGEEAVFYRQGLNLRWDWKNYAIVIKPDGTGLYYDFSYQSTDVKPTGLYQTYKF